MSRTYDNARHDRRGGGYEYWSRRINYAEPGKHKSGKKKTHTFERANERELIHDIEKQLLISL